MSDFVDTSSRTSAGTVIPSAVVAVGAVVVSILLFLKSTDEPSANYAAFMLAISGLLELTLVWWPRRSPPWLAFMPVVLEVFKGIALFGYCLDWGKFFASLVLFLAGLTILYTGWLAWRAIWRVEDGMHDPTLPSGVFLIWVMFIIFLHVMYLCAFSVAIYNRADNGRALLRTNSLDDFQENLPGAEERPVCVTARFDLNCPNADSQAGCMSDSDFIALAMNPGVQDQMLTQYKQDAGANAIGRQTIETLRRVVNDSRPQKGTAGDAGSEHRAQYSDATMTTAGETVANLAWLKERAVELCGPAKDRRPLRAAARPVCRVTLLGHATDDLKLKDSAARSANDLLAWRRAVSVFQVLDRMLGRSDIEWMLSSGSNRDYVMCAETSSRQDGVNHKLYTEIRLEKAAASLTLMDYLYFMTYTVSTTGYGDLVPAKPFVQLVVSVANLWEIFFVVICLNVILKSKDEGSEGAPKTAG